MTTSQERRIIATKRKSLKDQGILYSEYLGTYGNVLDRYNSLQEYLRETAIEAGFLRQPDQLSLYGNVETYEIKVYKDHIYYDWIKFYLGKEIEYITLGIGPESARMMFSGGTYSSFGTVFRMIDGICDILSTMSAITYGGWNIEEENPENSGTMLKDYCDEYYKNIARNLKESK